MWIRVKCVYEIMRGVVLNTVDEIIRGVGLNNVDEGEITMWMRS